MNATEKEVRLKAFTEELFPGRWESLRLVMAQELKATGVLSLLTAEASANIFFVPPEGDPRLKRNLTPSCHVVWL